jgi:hypothetical protein
MSTKNNEKINLISNLIIDLMKHDAEKYSEATVEEYFDFDFIKNIRFRIDVENLQQDRRNKKTYFIIKFHCFYGRNKKDKEYGCFSKIIKYCNPRYCPKLTHNKLYEKTGLCVRIFKSQSFCNEIQTQIEKNLKYIIENFNINTTYLTNYLNKLLLSII